MRRRITVAGSFGRAMLGAAGIALMASFVGAAQAQAPTEADAAVDAAIARGVEFLVTQQKDTGAIRDAGNETAITAISIMAMCAVGHQPTDGTKEGETLRKALDFVLRDDRQNDKGYYGGHDGSRMYGHGMISLMLAELLGMGVTPEQDRRIRQKLEKAIGLIIRAQDMKDQGDAGQFGGWRYEPESRDSDLSVTIWQLLALRAAKNAGIDVPKAAIEKAVRYLKKSYSTTDRGKRKHEGGTCRYQPGHQPTYAASAAGLLALQICGQYDSPEVAGSADWLMDEELNWDGRHFFYGTYYYAQGMYQRGGEYWEHARQEVSRLLLEKQKPDGSWIAGNGEEQNAGRVYCTAMGILSLSVKCHFLPIYQR